MVPSQAVVNVSCCELYSMCERKKWGGLRERIIATHGKSEPGGKRVKLSDLRHQEDL